MKEAAVYSFPEPMERAALFLEAKKRAGEFAQKEKEGLKTVLITPDDLIRCLHEQKDGLLITNGEGIGLWVNRAMEKVVGLTPGYFLNKPIGRLFEKGIFRYQAVTERARREKNELTDIQVVNTGNTVLVTSIPFTGQEEQLKYMITTVRKTEFSPKPGRSAFCPACRQLSSAWSFWWRSPT
jgi:PAS domain-containing protein